MRLMRTSQVPWFGDAAAHVITSILIFYRLYDHRILVFQAFWDRYCIENQLIGCKHFWDLLKDGSYTKLRRLFCNLIKIYMIPQRCAVHQDLIPLKSNFLLAYCLTRCICWRFWIIIYGYRVNLRDSGDSSEVIKKIAWASSLHKFCVDISAAIPWR